VRGDKNKAATLAELEKQRDAAADSDNFYDFVRLDNELQKREERKEKR